MLAKSKHLQLRCWAKFGNPVATLRQTHRACEHRRWHQKGPACLLTSVAEHQQEPPISDPLKNAQQVLKHAPTARGGRREQMRENARRVTLRWMGNGKNELGKYLNSVRENARERDIFEQIPDAGGKIRPNSTKC